MPDSIPPKSPADTLADNLEEQLGRHWHDEAKETAIEQILAEKAIMQGRILRHQAYEEAAREYAATGEWPESPPEMEMSVGNRTTSYITNEAPKTGSLLGSVVKYAAASALAAALGAGGMWLFEHRPTGKLPDVGHTVRVAIQHPDGTIEPVTAEIVDLSKVFPGLETPQGTP